MRIKPFVCLCLGSLALVVAACTADDDLGPTTVHQAATKPGVTGGVGEPTPGTKDATVSQAVSGNLEHTTSTPTPQPVNTMAPTPTPSPSPTPIAISVAGTPPPTPTPAATESMPP